MDKIELIKQAKNAYYNTGETIMSDYEYDKLVAEVGYEAVGAPVLDNFKKIDISDKPMLSLDKCHTAEEIENFAKGHNLVASVKCDGLSVRIIYEDGKIVSANTRGDGLVGQDITEHIKQFTNVPLVISTKERLVVDGEAVILQHDFDEINKNGEFKNPRNLAAGTLASLDTSLCRSRRLSFIAWDVIEIDGNLPSYFSRVKYLINYGFAIVPMKGVPLTVLSLFELKDYDDINEEIFNIAKKVGIPCDGVVWKFNDIAYGESLGRTAHHFNNGIAWKPAIKEYETVLRDIEWTMGRTGKITPVAIYDEIDVDGSTCNRASLHNVSVMYSTLHTPFKNQKIKIFEANEIIPQISWADDAIQECDFEVPKICPICGKPTEVRENDGIKTLWCINSQCDGKLVNRIDYFIGKKGIDVKGLSKSTVEKLINWGWVGNIKDIFSLSNFKEEWKGKPGFGEKSVNNILTAIESAKHTTLEQFIAGIGIPLIGRTVAKQICKKYHTWEEFQSAIGSKWSEFEGFGPEMERAINTFDYSESNEIYKLLIFDEYDGSNNNGTVSEYAEIPNLSGKTFCITGKVSIWKNRDELKAYIENAGGKVVGSMSSKVDYLINNDSTSTSAKNKAAQAAGIPIITEKEFKEL